MEVFVFFVMLLVFFIGGFIAGNSNNFEYQDMYEDSYEECIEALPRNKDCVATGINFKIVNKD